MKTEKINNDSKISEDKQNDNVPKRSIKNLNSLNENREENKNSFNTD